MNAGPISLPSNSTPILVYDARFGAWELEPVAALEVGNEALYDGHLLRMTASGVEDLGLASVGQLSEADATWTLGGVSSVPEAQDWVLVLGDGEDAGHWRLRDLTGGERFAFSGRVFESDVFGDTLAVRATNDVLGRVVNTFVRMAPAVIDAELVYEDGASDVLTGTPNHPFWVDAVRDYVPLGELDVGSVLHVQGGGEAILVGKTWRQGDFEQGSLFQVFDFEVQGLHSFYVRGEGTDAAGVLVHNSTGKAIFKRHDSPDLQPTGRHVTVEIQDGAGNSLGHFDQFDGKIGPTAPGGTPIHSVDLANPEAAAAFGREGADAGRYVRGKNDCVTGACGVANAGDPMNKKGRVHPDTVRQKLNETDP